MSTSIELTGAPSCGHRVLGPAVVERALVADVAQRVDVGVAVVVVVDADVVLHEVHGFVDGRDLAEHRHVVIGGHRVVKRGLRVQGQAQGHGQAVADELRCPPATRSGVSR